MNVWEHNDPVKYFENSTKYYKLFVLKKEYRFIQKADTVSGNKLQSVDIIIRHLRKTP